LNTTVKENVLFGEKMNESRYNNVIKVRRKKKIKNKINIGKSVIK